MIRHWHCIVMRCLAFGDTTVCLVIGIVTLAPRLITMINNLCWVYRVMHCLVIGSLTWHHELSFYCISNFWRLWIIAPLTLLFADVTFIVLSLQV